MHSEKCRFRGAVLTDMQTAMERIQGHRHHLLNYLGEEREVDDRSVVLFFSIILSKEGFFKQWRDRRASKRCRNGIKGQRRVDNL